jgi:hypothetical protein
MLSHHLGSVETSQVFHFLRIFLVKKFDACRHRDLFGRFALQKPLGLGLKRSISGLAVVMLPAVLEYLRTPKKTAAKSR